ALVEGRLSGQRRFAFIVPHAGGYRASDFVRVSPGQTIWTFERLSWPACTRRPVDESRPLARPAVAVRHGCRHTCGCRSRPAVEALRREAGPRRPQPPTAAPPPCRRRWRLPPRLRCSRRRTSATPCLRDRARPVPG